MLVGRGWGCAVVSRRLGGLEPRGFMTEVGPGQCSVTEGNGDLAFLTGGVKDVSGILPPAP